jgi:hypothetical protein
MLGTDYTPLIYTINRLMLVFSRRKKTAVTDQFRPAWLSFFVLGLLLPPLYGVYYESEGYGCG